MTDAVQHILDIADGGVKYETTKLPKIKIKQQSPMPSLLMLGIVAACVVLIFCVLSAVQILGIKNDINKMRKEKASLTEDIERLEGLTQTRYANLDGGRGLHGEK
ncbi:MAG: hypothetical protein IJQ37_01030 [Clostridia bacterium]|nr:hypothetical protein [Clostridia bacterium]